MVEMNLEQARFNMIQQQVRPWDVLDEKVLELMTRVPRELFVPKTYRNLAFSDTEIPLGHGAVMTAPKIEGRLLQALAINATDTVLEIGTGSGFTTALLAHQAQQVISVDIEGAFTNEARKKLNDLKITNVVLETGDAAHGWPSHAPYDAIAVTGAVAELDQRLLEQLKVGGRMFVVVGSAPVMEATLITRVADDAWQREVLFETELAPLRHAEPVRRFSF